MDVLNLQAQPLWIAIAVYLCAATIVWAAGGRIAGYADQISRRTGIGGAVVGMILLGAVTSLPEIAASATASVGGDAGLAVSNLLGGVAFQIVVLAIADAFLGKDALTSTVPNPSTILQGVACILLLSLAVSGTVVGDANAFGIGIWPVGIFLVYFGSMHLVRGQERDAGWMPDRETSRDHPKGSHDGRASSQEKGIGSKLATKTVVAAALILIAGYALTRSAEAIAGHTALSTNLAGLTLLAAATSLPELSTAIKAVRLHRYDMAIGDILGGNMFDITLILLVDVLYRGAPVLTEVGQFAGFAGLFGIALTSIYVIGMLERRDRTISRMGYDSLLVLLVYGGGVFLLFRMGASSGS